MSQPTKQNSGSGKNLDDLFRDAIGQQEYTPSPRIWRILNLKLLIRELLHFNFTNVPKLAFISAGSIVIVASLSYWALKPNGKETAETLRKNPVAAVSESVKPINNTARPPERIIQASPEQMKQPVPAEGKSFQQSNFPVKQTVYTVATIAAASGTEKTVSYSEPEPGNIDNTAELTENITASQEVRFMDPLVFSNFDLLPSADTLRFIRSGEVYDYVREKMPVPSFFSVSLGVAPEMAIYRSNGVSTKEVNYWTNAGIAYHYSRFSVRTGLGLGYTYDEGSYSIQYRSNDSISFYREVIGYYYDPDNPSKIIYITRNRAIYDSITHIADDRTRNRYTYLQIPLLFGYSILETSKISIGIEAGPALSFLINEKKAQPVIDIPYGRLIKLQDNTPSRLSTNWQLWVNLSIEYQFSKNWGLVINPYYKYFLTPPAQSSETGNSTTQAFGMDVGIQYLFGGKRNKK